MFEHDKYEERRGGVKILGGLTSQPPRPRRRNFRVKFIHYFDGKEADGR